MQPHAFQAADLPSSDLKEHSAANPLRKPQWLIKDVYLSAVFESEPAIPDN
jgi:hypothetical protein